MLLDMRGIIKKKDEALKISEDRKETIGILIFKIKKMNANFKQELSKLGTSHHADVHRLMKEIDQLRNNLRAVLFEGGRRVGERREGRCNPVRSALGIDRQKAHLDKSDSKHEDVVSSATRVTNPTTPNIAKNKSNEPGFSFKSRPNKTTSSSLLASPAPALLKRTSKGLSVSSCQEATQMTEIKKEDLLKAPSPTKRVTIAQESDNLVSPDRAKMSGTRSASILKKGGGKGYLDI